MRAVVLLACIAAASCTVPAPAGPVWAVVVDSSRFWFNYRHVSDALTVYQALKSGGVRDANITLMLGEDTVLNPRNVLPGKQFIGRTSHSDGAQSLFPPDTQVDAWGSAVSAQCFLAALVGDVRRGCPPPVAPPAESTLLLYLHGHGGEGFLKFRDTGEVTAVALAAALAEARSRGRFARALAVVDTCHAQSLGATLPPTSGRRPAWAAALHSALPPAWAARLVAFVDAVLPQWAPEAQRPVRPLGVEFVFSSGTHANSYAAALSQALGTPLGDGLVTALSPRLRALATALHGALARNATRPPTALAGGAGAALTALPRRAVRSTLVTRGDHAPGTPLSVGQVWVGG